MIYDIVPIIIILFCLVIIVIVSIKRFPQAAAIDLDNIPREKHEVVKREILKQRLKRNLEKFLSDFKEKLKFKVKNLDKSLNSLRKKIHYIEKEYHKHQRKIIRSKPILLKNRVKKLILQGEKFVSQEKLDEAERLFIEVITLDPGNLDAYRYLGEIYLKQKDLEHAKETFEYILKLNFERLKNAEKNGQEELVSKIKDELAKIYFDLGELFHFKERYHLAQDKLEKAIEYSSKNPKYLDFLCDIYIILKNKDRALETLEKLKLANPENNKIEDIERKIAEIV